MGCSSCGGGRNYSSVSSPPQQNVSAPSSNNQGVQSMKQKAVQGIIKYQPPQVASQPVGVESPRPPGPDTVPATGQSADLIMNGTTGSNHEQGEMVAINIESEGKDD